MQVKALRKAFKADWQDGTAEFVDWARAFVDESAERTLDRKRRTEA